MRRVRRDRYVPLFWRLFLPNALVLAIASVLLIVAPPNGRVPVVLGGFVVLLVSNLVLMRHTFAPLTRLADLTARVDPLRPGARLEPGGPHSEVRELTVRFNEMLERLEAERRDSARRALAAEQAQRRALARNLHDALGQALTAIRLQAAGLARSAPAGLRPEVAELVEGLDEALDELRRIARELRPEALDDLGLPAALEALCERIVQRTGQRVDAAIPHALPRLSHEGELVLYRVAQEALTNVVRHAGADVARLTLEVADGCVVLEVTDDGTGAASDDVERGHGIRGMRERALLIGAALTVEPRPDGGTVVRLEVPVSSA